MLLLIDAGNTRIKWQLRDQHEQVLSSAALNHDQLSALADLRPQLGSDCRIHASNVAGAAIAEQITDLLGKPHIDWLRPEASRCGVRNHYAPGQLGADRWAALIGAHALHPGPCLVVMAGTATTIDLLSASGDFLGGLIIPGLALMQEALTRGTAQLPLADGHFTQQPRRTVDAIHSGCIQAQAGAIERMFAQLPSSDDAALCLLGGGGAPAIAHALNIPVREVDNLVLHGLAACARSQPDAPFSQ